jgi:excisionase family DNA binding protein
MAMSCSYFFVSPANGTTRAFTDDAEGGMGLNENASENGFEPRIGRSVSLDHAAELLGVSRRTIYNRIREGRLQTIRTLGGSQRVLLDSMHDSLGEAMNAQTSDKNEHAIGRRPSY